jgi:hypothetical protein
VEWSGDERTFESLFTLYSACTAAAAASHDRLEMYDVCRAVLCWKMKFPLECLLCELHVVIDLVVIEREREREREKREMQKSRGQTWPIIASINNWNEYNHDFVLFVCDHGISNHFFLPFRFLKKKKKKL